MSRPDHPPNGTDEDARREAAVALEGDPDDHTPG